MLIGVSPLRARVLVTGRVSVGSPVGGVQLRAPTPTRELRTLAHTPHPFRAREARLCSVSVAGGRSVQSELGRECSGQPRGGGEGECENRDSAR